MHKTDIKVIAIAATVSLVLTVAFKLLIIYCFGG